MLTNANFPRCDAQEHQQFDMPSIATTFSSANARKRFLLSSVPAASFLSAVRGDDALTWRMYVPPRCEDQS